MKVSLWAGLCALLLLPACSDAAGPDAPLGNSQDAQLVAVPDGHVPLKDIKMGQYVRVRGGGTAMVSDVITGFENIVYSVRTDDFTLSLTPTTVVATRAGSVRVRELHVRDQLITEAGDYATVRSVETMVFNSNVIVLRLKERPAFISVGGIWIGDYDTETDPRIP